MTARSSQRERYRHELDGIVHVLIEGRYSLRERGRFVEFGQETIGDWAAQAVWNERKNKGIFPYGIKSQIVIPQFLWKVTNGSDWIAAQRDLINLPVTQLFWN